MNVRLVPKPNADGAFTEELTVLVLDRWAMARIFTEPEILPPRVGDDVMLVFPYSEYMRVLLSARRSNQSNIPTPFWIAAQLAGVSLSVPSVAVLFDPRYLPPSIGQSSVSGVVKIPTEANLPLVGALQVHYGLDVTEAEMLVIAHETSGGILGQRASMTAAFGRAAVGEGVPVYDIC